MSSATVPTATALVRRKPPAAVRRRRFLLAVANHSLLIVAAIAFLAPFVFIAHDRADDEQPGAVLAHLAASVPLAELR